MKFSQTATAGQSLCITSIQAAQRRDSQLAVVVNLNLLLTPRRGVCNVELQGRRTTGPSAHNRGGIQSTCKEEGKVVTGRRHTYLHSAQLWLVAAPPQQQAALLAAFRLGGCAASLREAHARLYLSSRTLLCPHPQPVLSNSGPPVRSSTLQGTETVRRSQCSTKQRQTWHTQPLRRASLAESWAFSGTACCRRARFSDSMQSVRCGSPRSRTRRSRASSRSWRSPSPE